MGFTINTTSGDKLTPSRRVPPGWYHAVLTQVKETDKCDGIKIVGDVLAGKPNDSSETDIVGTNFQLTFWFPDTSKPEEQQERANAKLTALLIATDLVRPDQLGQPIDVEPSVATGRHVLIHLRFKQKKVEQNGKETWVDDPQFLDLAFNDILHIDDPAGSNVPKNVSSLKFIPPTNRHQDAKYFAFKAKAGAAGAPVASAAAQPAAAAAVPGGF